jgi:hypothetical protein
MFARRSCPAASEARLLFFLFGWLNLLLLLGGSLPLRAGLRRGPFEVSRLREKLRGVSPQGAAHFFVGDTLGQPKGPLRLTT